MARVVNPTQDERTRNRTYLKPEHRNDPGIFLTSLWSIKRGKHVSVCYKVRFDKKQYRTPASLTRWLDDKDPDFIDREIGNFKVKLNSSSSPVDQKLSPEFYVAHLPRFIKLMIKSGVQKKTIEGYKRELENYVFPYFVGRLRLFDPKKWDSEYIRWARWLETKKKTDMSQKKPVVALRRYLKFLTEVDNYQYKLPECRSSNRNAKLRFLPGDTVPEMSEVLEWIQTLPSSRNRWVIAIMATFGVRISEALAITKYSIVSKRQLDEFTKVDRLAASALKVEPAPSLFCEVDTAKKRKISDPDIVLRYGDLPDHDRPKTRCYLAASFDKQASKLIVSMTNNKEDCKGEEPTQDSVYRAIKNSDHPLFQGYSPHDFRRWNITVQALATRDFWIVSRLHGHVSEDTTRQYYMDARKIIRRDEDDLPLEIY